MHQVKCPTCGNIREVKAKKPWMKGPGPYECLCKVCCQTGREVSAETRQKLSASVALAQTDEIRQHKSEVQKALYESGNSNLIAGQSSGWNKGLSLPPREESVKEKIGLGVSQARKKESQK